MAGYYIHLLHFRCYDSKNIFASLRLEFMQSYTCVCFVVVADVTAAHHSFENLCS